MVSHRVLFQVTAMQRNVGLQLDDVAVIFVTTWEAAQPEPEGVVEKQKSVYETID